MKWFSISIFCIFFSIVIGLVINYYTRPVKHPQEITYTQEQVDKLIDVVVAELVKCDEDLYKL